MKINKQFPNPAFLLAAILFTAILLTACAQPPQAPQATPSEPATVAASATAEAATATPTTTPPASATLVPATETPVAAADVDLTSEATATPGSSIVTATPYPGPRPTSGPLNAAVPMASTGAYECGDYPCFDDVASWEARINVPSGFEARYVAQVEPHPTSLTFGPDGLLYVARQEGAIVTLDLEGDGVEDDGERTATPFLDGFYHLVAIAFQPGSERLFAASRGEGDDEAIIWVVDEGQARVLYDGLPCCYGGWHQANGIAFGPDGYGYVPLGALSDHGESGELHPLEATVLRFDPDGGGIEPFAYGLRNTFDIAWDSQGRLFGADNMPDHGPPEEFNEIVPGAHHGFPYYGDCQSCTPAPPDLQIVAPLHDLLAHSAPTGITTYLHEAFPGAYDNIFLTLWSAFPGAQKIVRLGPGGEGITDFATGFAAPVDVTVGPRGSLFVLDWATGIIFEIAYTKDGS